MATDYPEARALALAAILPAGQDRHVALFLGNPIAGGVELTLTGYARVAHQDWSTSDLVGKSERVNATPITFAPITSAGSTDYWAIYDAAVAGVLLRSGLVLDDLGQPIVIPLTGADDQPQFNSSTLRIEAEDI